MIQQGKSSVLWLVLCSLWLTCGNAHALTVTGILRKDTRWTAAMSPVTLSGDVTVARGVTLTIDPGVEVRAKAGDDQKNGTDTKKVELIIDGTLNATGTSKAPIKIQSSSTTAGAWHGIRVAVTGKVTLSYTHVQYAKHGIVKQRHHDDQR